MHRIFRTLCVRKGNRVGLRKLPNYYFSQILAYIFLPLFQLHIHLLSKIKKMLIFTFARISRLVRQDRQWK